MGAGYPDSAPELQNRRCFSHWRYTRVRRQQIRACPCCLRKPLPRSWWRSVDAEQWRSTYQSRPGAALSDECEDLQRFEALATESYRLRWVSGTEQAEVQWQNPSGTRERCH